MKASLAWILCLAGCGHRCGGGGPAGEPPPPTWACDDADTGELSVDLGSVTTSVLRHGYVHGIRDPDPKNPEAAAWFLAAKALGARTWRVSDPYHLRFLAPLGVEVTYVLMDGFANYDPNVHPWSPDYGAWDAYVADAVQRNLDAGSPVTWFDVWGEPPIDASNEAQVLETYRRTYEIIRAHDPKVKIVAPSMWEFDEPKVTAFLDTAVASGQVYDAICWHDFSDDPTDLLGHARRMRELIAGRPTLRNPELHVNEYSSELQHLVPAFNVAWLALLEASGVNVANRACWDSVVDSAGTYGDCWAGIEGVYMRDGVTPQPAYHVLAPYGALTATRYAAASSNPRVAALAGRDRAAGTVRILSGYVGAPSAAGVRLGLALRGLSWTGNLHYDVDRVPSGSAPLEARPLREPLKGPAGDAPITAGSATIDVGCIPRGAAVVVRLGE